MVRRAILEELNFNIINYSNWEYTILNLSCDEKRDILGNIAWAWWKSQRRSARNFQEHMLYFPVHPCFRFLYRDSHSPTNGLKYQNLQLRMKKNVIIFLILFNDFRFCLGIGTTHLTYQALNVFTTWKNSINELAFHIACSIMHYFVLKRNLRQWHVICVVTILRPNLKS